MSRLLALPVALFVALLAAPSEAGAPASGSVPDAEATFRKVMELIRTDHVDADITEDELWTGAIEGMLARLHEGEKQPVNALLDPSTGATLTSGVAGRVTGVGVVIKRLEDQIVVQGLLEGGGAEAAGVREGDRILAVDGAWVADMPFTDAVGRIRGPEGSTVRLMVQRGADETTLEVTRASIVVPSVEGRMLDDRTGWLRFRHFSETTSETLGRALAELRADGAERLVVDVRGCPGGLLDPAVEAAQVFLSDGSPVVTMQWRGQEPETIRAAGHGSWRDAPVAVLVDDKTASGCEIFAAALGRNGRGRLLGSPTYGKGTVERLYTLSGGWALKLSAGRFAGPDGEAWGGTGLVPDIAVADPSEEAADPASDPWVRAALTVLDLQR